MAAFDDKYSKDSLEFKVVKGDSLNLPFDLYDENGVALTLSDYVVTFHLFDPKTKEVLIVKAHDDNIPGGAGVYLFGDTQAWTELGLSTPSQMQVVIFANETILLEAIPYKINVKLTKVINNITTVKTMIEGFITVVQGASPEESGSLVPGSYGPGGINWVIVALQALEVEVGAYSARITQAEADIDDLQPRMTAAEADIDALEVATASLDTRLDTAESDIDGLEARMTTAEGDIDDLETFQGTVDAIATKKSKLDATSAPTVSNDSSQGYAVGSIWVDVTNKMTYACVDASVGAAVWSKHMPQGLPCVDIFASSGTWTKRDGLTSVEYVLIGGGGGGGSARRGATFSNRAGGGGGGGGGRTIGKCLASALSATESVAIGAGGVGGAAVASNDTNGNNGTTGGITTFGLKARAIGGGGGGGAGATTSTGGVAGNGAFAGAVGANGDAGNGSAGIASLGASASGASGGGVSSSDVAGNGATGGNFSFSHKGSGGGTAGVAPGGNGGNGADTVTAEGQSGSGGGSGAGNTTGAGGNGGDGGTPGGGGGGGGASPNGSLSGAGGDGGNGLVVVLNI